MRRWMPGTVALVALGVLLSGCATHAEPTDTPQAAETAAPEAPAPTNSVLQLSLGDCVMDAATPLSADLTEVPTVPCDQPHDSELFAVVTVAGDTYPGVDDLVAQGQTQCQALFSEFVGIDFRSSLLDFHFYYPTPSSWVQGDRSIYCMVTDPGLTVVGTLQGSAR